MQKKSRGLLCQEYRSESPPGRRRGPTPVWLPGLNKPGGSTGQLHTSGHTVHTRRPDQASFYPVCLSVSLQFLFLSHFGPLWVLPEAQTDRGLNDLRIKMSYLGQCRHTSPLSEVHPFAKEPGPSSPPLAQLLGVSTT